MSALKVLRDKYTFIFIIEAIIAIVLTIFFYMYCCNIN